MTSGPRVEAIPYLDVMRYTGTWYEIGRLPLRWEPAGATDVTATYSMNDDASIRVDNRCFDADGTPIRSVGRAVPTGERTSELSVSFLPEPLQWIPFTSGDYWVLRIDDAYEHALVGTRDHKNLWLLARSPQVTPQMKDAYLDTAREQGFDLTEWIEPAHTGRAVTDAMLGDS